MLGRVAQHMVAPSASLAASHGEQLLRPGPSELVEQRPDPPRLLKDAEIHQFVVNGFITVQPSLSAQFHRSVKEDLDAILEDEGNPGNNLLPRMPALQSMLDDPVVAGAVQSLCGRNALLHPHRFVHARSSDDSPDNLGQSWHKDDYLYDPVTRHKHLFRWVFLFYYPEAVTLDMGPTGILPGCHHLQRISHTDPQIATETPYEFTVPAGAVALAHFDNWHRGGANKSGRTRYMLKWMYMRMEEPVRADWDHRNARWPTVAELPPLVNAQHYSAALAEALWDWMRGEWQVAVSQRETAHTSAMELALVDNDESVQVQTDRLQAAYSLRFATSETQGDAVRLAVTKLCESGAEAFDWDKHHEKEQALGFLNIADRPFAHALSALGIVAAPVLCALLAGAERSESFLVRAVAACVIGGIGSTLTTSEQGEQALQALLQALTDESEWVRRNAAHAVGVLGPMPSTALEASIATGLGSLLSDSADMVRANAAVSLARRAREVVLLGSLEVQQIREELMRVVRAPQAGIGSHGNFSDPRIGRYTRFYALDALRRLLLADAGSNREFLDYMMQQFWCPDTTTSSPF